MYTSLYAPLGMLGYVYLPICTPVHPRVHHGGYTCCCTRYHGRTGSSGVQALEHHVTERDISDGPLTVTDTRFTVGRG